jgi:hypothetical protein
MRLATLLLPIAVSAAAQTAFADHTTMVSHMDGGSVVPPTGSSATATLSIDFLTDEYSDPHWCSFEALYEGLSSRPTGLSIRKSPPGENGSVLYTLVSGYFDSPTHGGFPMALADLRLLQSSDSLYAIVSTEAFPDGELRGTFQDETELPISKTSWGRVRALYRRLGS